MRPLAGVEGRGRGFSLWLMPDGESLGRLTTVVGRLAARLGTPAFAPHVTLLAGLAGEEADLVARAEALATRLARLGVELAEVEGRDEYFRCLYVRAEPAASLRARHGRAAAAFGVPPDRDFLPHLSLVYGRLSADEKQRIAESIESDLPVSFEATTLEVWRTEGAVAEWVRRGRFALGGRQSDASSSSSARRKDGGSTAG